MRGEQKQRHRDRERDREMDGDKLPKAMTKT